MLLWPIVKKIISRNKENNKIKIKIFFFKIKLNIQVIIYIIFILLRKINMKKITIIILCFSEKRQLKN